MTGIRMFCVILVWTYLSECSGITNYENEKNLIGEEDRRGVIVKEDLKNSETTKRGLWLISQNHHSADYDSTGLGGGYHGSSGPGGYGYVDSAGYGITGSGYNYEGGGGGVGGGGGYHRGPNFGYGYGYNGGGSNYGHGGANFGHSGYGDTGHEVSHGNEGYSKLALKKLLVPLAGLALLGAAVAFSSNPVLLQLGSIQSGRRKRSVNSDISKSKIYPLNPWTRPDVRN